MSSKGLAAAAAAALAVACSPASEEAMAQPGPAGRLVIDQVVPRDQTPIQLASPARDAEGAFADRYSAYHQGVSPPLSWSPVAGAAAYAVIVEDPDAPRPQPFLHWMAWNIPGDVVSLPEGVATAAHPPTPEGMVQGRNGRGEWGWFGPRPPSGVHHYHVQVFALDTPLSVGPGSQLSLITDELKAHALAEGELIATYAAPGQQNARR